MTFDQLCDAYGFWPVFIGLILAVWIAGCLWLRLFEDVTDKIPPDSSELSSEEIVAMVRRMDDGK